MDRNRTDSLLLLRIQNGLNSLALAMRDMLEGSEPYPLTAWRAQFQRIRARSGRRHGARRSARRRAQRRSAAVSGGFGDPVLGRAGPYFRAGRRGEENEARDRIRLSLASAPGGDSAPPWRACWCRTTKPSRRPAARSRAHLRPRRKKRLPVAGCHGGPDCRSPAYTWCNPTGGCSIRRQLFPSGAASSPSN